MHQSRIKLIWLILILPLILAVLNLSYLWRNCFSPTDTSNPESIVIYFADRVAKGESLYLDFHEPPYIIMPYTPLYHWLLGNVAGWLHLSIDSMFVLGRIFTFICCLLTGILIYWKSRKSGETMYSSLSGILFFLSAYLLWPWGATNRPDILAVLLSLSGFVIYTSRNESPWRWMGVPFFVLAFFAKQSYISAPAAIFLFLLLNRKTKEAVAFAAACLIPLISVLFIMDQLSNGTSTMNLVDLNFGAPTSLLNLRLIFMMALQVVPLSIILAATGAVEKGWRAPETIYFVLSLMLGIMASTKLGSHVNYFIESLAAGCLLIPAGLRFLIDALPGRRSAFLVGCFLVLLIPSINFMIHSLTTLSFPKDTRILSMVRNANIVVSDNPRFALTGRMPFFIEPFSLSYMEKVGKWSSKHIVDMLRRHEIQLVVLNLPVERSSSWQGFKRLPAPVIEAIQKYYKSHGTIDGYQVYTPKQEAKK